MIKKIFLNLLNYEAKSKNKENEKMFKLIGINKGNCIADIGSGGGFFTFKFAELVGNEATVYAVDIENYNLKYISEQAKKKGINNIKTISATSSSPMLFNNSIDIIFARNMFHHLEDPISYFKNCKQSLKENGKIAIIDGKKTNKNKYSHMVLFKHYTDQNKIISIMKEAGYSHVKSEIADENHSLNIFSANQP